MAAAARDAPRSLPVHGRGDHGEPARARSHSRSDARAGRCGLSGSRVPTRLGCRRALGVIAGPSQRAQSTCVFGGLRTHGYAASPASGATAVPPIIAADAACDWRSPRAWLDVVISRHPAAPRLGDLLTGFNRLAARGASTAVVLRDEAKLALLHGARLTAKRPGDQKD